MKKMMRNSILAMFLLIMALWTNQCTKKNAEYKEIEEKTFVQVYSDVTAFADLVDPKLREAFVDSVLQHHQVRREDFQYTISVYSKDEKKWEEIFKKIVAELERREKELGAKSDSVKIGEK
jgi:hypothetical protein